MLTRSRPAFVPALICTVLPLCAGVSTARAQARQRANPSNSLNSAAPTARFGNIEIDQSRAKNWGDLIDGKELKKQIAGLKGALLYREGAIGFYRVGFEAVGNRRDGQVRVTVTIVGQSGGRTILASSQNEQLWRGGVFRYQEQQLDASGQTVPGGVFGNNSTLQIPAPTDAYGADAYGTDAYGTDAYSAAFDPTNYRTPFARFLEATYRECAPTREEKTGHSDDKKRRDDPQPKREEKRAPNPEPKREPKREERPEPRREEKRAPDPQPKREERPEPKREERPEPKREERPEPRREERPEPRREDKRAPDPQPEPKRELQPQRDNRPQWERKTKPRREETAPPQPAPPVVEAPRAPDPQPRPEAPRANRPEPQKPRRVPAPRPRELQPYNPPVYQQPTYQPPVYQAPTYNPPTYNPPATRPAATRAPDPNPPRRSGSGLGSGTNRYPDPNPPYRGGASAPGYTPPRHRPYRDDWGSRYYDYFGHDRNYYNYNSYYNSYNYYDYAPRYDNYPYDSRIGSFDEAPFINSYAWSQRASDEGARQAFEFALISARASAQADFDRQLMGAPLGERQN